MRVERSKRARTFSRLRLGWRHSLTRQAVLWVSLCSVPCMVAPTRARQESVRAPVMVSIPQPELTSLEPSSRRRIESLRTGIEELVENEAPAASVGQAIGLLGQFFHAVELHAAARDCYREAQRLQTEEPRWPYLQALVSLSLGEIENAADDLARAVELDPKQAAFELRLGDVELELGRATASDHFQQVLASSSSGPLQIAAHYGLGRAALLRGELEEAVRHMDAVLEGDPQVTRAHYFLAQSHRRLGHGERAKLHQALIGDAEPAVPDPMSDTLRSIQNSLAVEVTVDLARGEDFSQENFLGFVLSRLGQVAGAAGELGQFVARLEQENQLDAVELGRLAYAIGVLQIAEGNDSQAVASLEQAIRLAPGLVDAYVKLGNALARTGDLDVASEAFRQALEKEPSHGKARLRLAAVYANGGKLREARRELEKLLELEPDNTEAAIALAQVVERSGDPSEAIAQLRTLGERAVDTADSQRARLALAGALARSGDASRAIELYQEILDQSPQVPDALRALGSLQGQQGNYAGAVATYRRYIEAEPLNPLPRLGEATALILSGQHQQARERLEEGLHLLPTSLDLSDLLARHLAGCPDHGVRDGRRALELAQRVFEALPSAESLETLAMAYAEAGDFTSAVERQQQLIDGHGQAGPAAVVASWRQNLELYRQQQPCCAGDRSQ